MRKRTFFFHALYLGHQQSMSRLKMDLSTQKIWIKKFLFHLKCLPTSKDSIKKKNSTQVCPVIWVLVNSRCSQFDNQEWPSQIPYIF